MKIMLAIFIAVICLVTQPENLHAQELTVKSVQNDLKVEGPRKVVSSLYSDRDKWNECLRNFSELKNHVARFYQVDKVSP